MVTAKIWLSELGLRGLRRLEPAKRPTTVGILAFETARTMSLLLSLYNSLSDSEVRALRLDVFRSEGVRYLNSTDEGFLLNLACSERIEDLDRVALAVSRLGKKCQAAELQGFDKIYDDLKIGSVDVMKLCFPDKKIAQKIQRIEKLISATAELYSGLEFLNEMEASERKLRQWMSCSGPTQAEAKSNPDQFLRKLALQRKHVRRMRAASLWNQPLEKIVPIMARLICNVFARICIVFGPYVSDLPHVVSDGRVLFIASPQRQLDDTGRSAPSCYTSAPLERSVAKDVIIRSSGPIPQKPKSVGVNIFRNRRPKQQETTGMWLGFGSEEKRRISRKRNPVTKEASKSTLGGSGLSSRYATVISVAERLVRCPDVVDEGTREELYEMLPEAVRVAVKTRLRGLRRCEGLGPSDADDWREALERMMDWLGPMAHSMLRWQTERSYEQQRFDSRPTVLLLQTLYFSDREKTEAAIVELLIGLSCICRYTNANTSSACSSQGLMY
eukprot:TRINITY_DN23254_c1_g1_i1.p1 TRINITY_DN23254_c1_g1~~TRINITY_DN23254_c1_g1_i1.p1  ORF type:complete len:539 (-),score=55.20 TRINITY_DN23254_c1_g1_i1:250-1752(-)